MMRTGMRPFALAAVLALGTGACEDGITDSNLLDEAAMRADVALVAADGMFQDLTHMQSPAVWAGIGSAPGAVGIEIQGSKTFSKTVTFFDKNNTEQARYHPVDTEKMHIVSDLTREVTHTFWSASIARHRDMTVTGLYDEETERTWNGTATGDVDKSRHPEDGSVRTYDMNSMAVIEDVVRGVPRAENPYPKSGTITRTIHAEKTVDGVTEIRDVVTKITFDGDNTALMTVDNESWEINLDDRGVKKRFQRKNG